MDTFIRDLKYAFRSFHVKPGLTAVALLALALGIGANTALFSILYAALWKPLPFRDSERLAILWETERRREVFQNVVNPANYMDWKEQNKVFEDIAAFAQTGTANLTGVGVPEQISIQYATPNLFRVLGIRPVLGRDFVNNDGVGEEDRIVILSNGLWMRRFGSDAKIVGKDILLNGRKARVIGVMPPEWNWYIKEGSIFGKPPELWMAFPITPEMRQRQGRYLTTVARLRPGVTMEQAQANMDLVARQLAERNPDFNEGWGVNVVPLREQFSGNLRKPLWMLAGAVVFVLLIACTNVANLMLARAIHRSREMALRSVLGAKRARLIRQLLTESVLLALIGGTAGVLIAVWGTESLAALGQRAGIDFRSVDLNLSVLLFAFGVSVLSGLFFGIVPSLIASGWNLHEQLKEGGKGSTGFRTANLRKILVISQLAIAVLLLSGATLLIRSFWKLSTVNPGFDSKQILTFRIVLPSLKYPEDAQRVQVVRNMLDRLQSLPGVKSAGMVSFLPFAVQAAGTNFEMEGRPSPPPGQDRITKVFVVDNGFFRTLNVPTRKGRVFYDAEMQEQKHVVLINEAFLRQYYPGEDPIGKKITINMKDENVPSQIIGVVGDVKQEQLDSPTEPSIYWPHPELAYSFATIVLRTDSDPLDHIPAVTATVRDIDRDQPVAELRTMEEWLGDSTARARFQMTLLVILAAVALILAGAGIYGVMSHAVLQRTQEMGIRMALGASTADVFRLVLKEGARILMIGLTIGCSAALVLTRLIQSLLFQTSTTDPLIFAVVIGTLLLFGLLACWIPSRRAATVSPVEALHYE